MRLAPRSVHCVDPADSLEFHASGLESAHGSDFPK